jgi:hypothetical protein
VNHVLRLNKRRSQRLISTASMTIFRSKLRMTQSR